MSFVPSLPLGGVAGWNFLARTMDTQKAAQQGAASQAREIAYFRENIGKVTTPEQLVGDYTLMKVALGAFGLQDDISNKFFVRKVLAEGVLDQGSFANRLGDPRYAALSKAFGFGTLAPPRTSLPSFPDEILAGYRDQSFEVAVGEVQPDLRLALGLERELTRVLDGNTSANARWFGVMGSPPLREVFEAALGLPGSFAALDIDQQLVTFRQRSEAVFGVSEVADFAEPDMMGRLRDRFLLMNEIRNGPANVTAAPVLSLLSGAGGVSAATLLSTLYARP